MSIKRSLICIIIIFSPLFSTVLVGGYKEGQVYRHELNNGLVVFTMERHIAPLIYHQLTYRVGSRNEHLGITGVSHVVEHMMFKGTKKYSKGVASKTISKNAGIFNAFTMNDMTSYYEYLPSNKIDIAMDVESDRMMNCIFDTAEFRSEIQVIRQERRMRSESTSGGVLQENLNSVAYMSHPNRDPIIGWPKDLENLTRDRAYEYYRTYYTPNNAFLVLVGDFETDVMLKKVEQYYGVIPRGPEVKDVLVEDQPQRVKKTITLFHNDITSPTISFAFHVPIIKHPDGVALRVAGSILGTRSRTSRLYKRLVEERQIATSAAAGMPTTKDPGLFRITVLVRKDSSVETAETLVWDEIKKMQTEPVTDNELQKIKNRFVFNDVSDYTKNADIGSRLSTYETYFGLDYIKEFQEKVQKVTKDDIQRVMKEYFATDKVTLAYSYPKDPKVRLPKREQEQEGNEEERNRSDKYWNCPIPGREGNDAFFFQNSPQDTTAEEFDPNDIVKPKPIEPQIKKGKLDNGIPIYTIENHLAPTIFIGGIFETGMITEAVRTGKPGLVSMLTGVMNRGTKTIAYDSLSERMSFVPYSFNVGGSFKSLYFQGQSLVKDADEMVKVGFELVTQPGFRDEDFSKVRNQLLDFAKKRRKTTRERAFYYMFDKIFNNHPYAYSDATEESINQMSKDDIVKLQKKYFQPSILTIVMVGDMTHKEMTKLANKYFGIWKSKSPAPAKTSIPAAQALDGREIKVYQDKEYTESTINIGFAPFNNIDEEDEEVIDVLNHILASSALTSRIGIELRDKRGLVYGVKSQLWSSGDPIGYWKFQTKTAPKNTEQVIGIIYTEIHKMLESGITDNELNTAKKRLFGLMPFYVETPDDIATQTFDLLRHKKPLNTFDKKADRLLAVTKEKVLAAARKYFTLDKFIIVVDGPIEEHSLDSLKLQLPKSVKY